jgi:hypothetical protein
MAPLALTMAAARPATLSVSASARRVRAAPLQRAAPSVAALPARGGFRAALGGARLSPPLSGGVALACGHAARVCAASALGAPCATSPRLQP